MTIQINDPWFENIYNTEFEGNSSKFLETIKSLLIEKNQREKKVIKLLKQYQESKISLGKIAQNLNIIDEDKFEFVWVLDFPMFEVEEGKLKAMHHPFTMPDNINLPLEEMGSISYDLAMNGEELGGGSIRIHKTDIQKQIFNLPKRETLILVSGYNVKMRADAGDCY